MTDQRDFQGGLPVTSIVAAGPFSAADLPIDEQGRVYHLQLKPGQIAPDVILVGDPGRADFIGSTFLREREVEHAHRGLVTITGIAEISGQPATIISPLKTTVTTSGIGTPSLEIVINELVALTEIDFATRTRKAEFPRLHVIRVGTSGALQAGTRLGTPIVTTYAIGLDNTGLYYEAPCPDESAWRIEEDLTYILRHAMSRASRFYTRIHPYVSRAEPTLVAALLQAARDLRVSAKPGLTASCAGFFAPQGRDTARLQPSLPNLDRILSDYNPRVDGQRVENMEMESSFLLHFLGGLGHWGASICPVIANRRENTFDPHYQQAVHNAISVALLALASAREHAQPISL